MAGGNAARFDAVGPEGDILAKHWVGVHGAFHRFPHLRSPSAKYQVMGGLK
jgi:hypothetical protein